MIPGARGRQDLLVLHQCHSGPARICDIQQAIKLGIHERFEQEAIEFAYPTQTLFVHTASQQG